VKGRGRQAEGHAKNLREKAEDQAGHADLLEAAGFRIGDGQAHGGILSSLVAEAEPGEGSEFGDDHAAENGSEFPVDTVLGEKVVFEEAARDQGAGHHGEGGGAAAMVEKALVDD
jgi:hypothetical protein